jgi:hypothetical protein
MLNLNTTLEYKLLFGIMSSVLYILLLTSVVIIFFRLSKKGTDYALIGIKSYNLERLSGLSSKALIEHSVMGRWYISTSISITLP